ncbi:uncharacterized protein [Ptychodera flava]|uniref:uncharacterized protein n=1 Tax=Ptychodera flava TaxID=63121 RepID=UPI00396A94F8
MPLMVRSRYTIIKLLCCLTAATVAMVVFHQGVIGVKRNEDQAVTQLQWKVEKGNQTRGVNTHVYFNLTTSEASSGIALTRNETKGLIYHNNRTDTPAVYRERSQLIELPLREPSKNVQRNKLHQESLGGRQASRLVLPACKGRQLELE